MTTGLIHCATFDRLGRPLGLSLLADSFLSGSPDQQRSGFRIPIATVHQSRTLFGPSIPPAPPAVNVLQARKNYLRCPSQPHPTLDSRFLRGPLLLASAPRSTLFQFLLSRSVRA